MIAGAHSLLLSLVIGLTALAQDLQAPVPANYDPIPGPFAVFVDVDGALSEEAKSIIANATDYWSGDHYSAFLLCYRPPSAARTMSSGLAQAAVARELKLRGAKVVVSGTPETCDGKAVKMADRSRVEIRGVIQQ